MTPETGECMQCPVQGSNKEDIILWLTTALTETDQQAREEDSRYRKIAELITSIFYYGNFKAETDNERELEKLLREVNLWPTNEQVIIQRTTLSNPPSQV